MATGAHVFVLSTVHVVDLVDNIQVHSSNTVMGTALSLHCHFQKKKWNDVRYLIRSPDWSRQKVLRNENLYLIRSPDWSRGPRTSGPFASTNQEIVLGTDFRSSGPFASTNQEIVLGTSHRSTFFF